MEECRRILEVKMVKKPAVSIKYGEMTFNMACIRLFEGIKYILPIVNTAKKRMALIMCPEEDSASVEWARQKNGVWVNKSIVKIVSFLNVLICVYNNPSMCLVIDELDSGVFEYLLGELLAVFSDGGKGQLIFTSHNLRALEMLGKKSILFSTTNPCNRYIRLQNVQTNNNLRDLYLRSLTLGGQKEEMYEETDSVAIGRAFRRAGKAVEAHVES